VAARSVPPQENCAVPANPPPATSPRAHCPALRSTPISNRRNYRPGAGPGRSILWA
jgi:hypothetical protein